MKWQEFNSWKNQVFSKYSQIQEQVGESDFKKYNLDISCRALNKIAPNNLEEEKFLELKQVISQTLNAIPQNNICKASLKPYHKNTKHLKHYLKQHFNLVPVGYHSIRWGTIGLGFGLPYSYFLTSLLGLFIGLGIGMGIGTYFDKKADRENKSY